MATHCAAVGAVGAATTVGAADAIADVAATAVAPPGEATAAGTAAAKAAAAAGSAAAGTAAAAAATAGGGVRLLVVVGVALLDVPGDDARDGSCDKSRGAATSGGSEGRPVRVLLAQRPAGKANAGLWEFPGGKVDPGETPEAALARELKEELGIAVRPSDLQPLTFASHTYPTFHLLMPLYVCKRWAGTPTGAEGQAVVWATAEEVASYPLTPADIPLVPAVLGAMRQTSHGQ